MLWDNSSIGAKANLSYMNQKNLFTQPPESLPVVMECAIDSTDSENSLFSSGRSIAHMLPPIKPSAVEENTNQLVASGVAENMEAFFNVTEDGSDQNVQSWQAYQLPSSSTESQLSSEQKDVVGKLNECLAISRHSWLKDKVADEPVLENLLGSLKEKVNKKKLKSKFNAPQNKDEQVVSRCENTDDTPISHDIISDSRLSVQELVGQHKEIDTQLLARKVKDVLLQNNIGQRLFGQAVLGLTQGSVSDLLSHPKPWQTLSLKGREPFVRMQLWLDNPKNIEQVRSLKSEKGSDINLRPNVSSVFGGYKSNSSKKKPRVVLSTQDKLILLQAYEKEPYPSQATVQELAERLNKQPSTVINWFHNYRSRVKRGFFPCDDASNLQSASGKRKLKQKVKHIDKTSPENSTVADLPATSCLETLNQNSATEEQKSFQLLTPFREPVTGMHPNSMFITATVVLTKQSDTVQPMWFHVANNGNVLDRSGALTTVLINLHSSSNPDTKTAEVTSLPPATTLLKAI